MNKLFNLEFNCSILAIIIDTNHLNLFILDACSSHYGKILLVVKIGYIKIKKTQTKMNEQ